MVSVGRAVRFAVTLSLIVTTSAALAWSQVRQERSGDNPRYKLTINVVERSTPAINYRHRGGATKVGFQGTQLLPRAHGEAKVESKQGYIEIEVEFDELESATRFGPEYLTYVMWAVTPEGRAINLGEVILNGSESKLNVTTDMQSFGLIVTAEPHFAVRQPSNVVVLENVIRPDTRGTFEVVDAKYELLERGQYTVNVAPEELKPMNRDSKTPLDLYEARNAVRIAHWAGADKDAAESYQKAQALLAQAETYHTKKESLRSISQAARQAVQTAEDAREIALKRQAELRAQKERDETAAREAADRRRIEESRRVAEQEALSRAKAEQEQKLESERRARAEADAARVRAEAELEARRAADERNRLQTAVQAEAEKARMAVEQAEREKAELRRQLTQQLNLILETRDSARGLIVNMSDVLFDTAKWTLKPGAREKLAKIAGIVVSHPGLVLQIEGHTDNVGGDDYNQNLSERRANSVRDYLINQGVKSETITAKGFGESMPVADNSSAAGRQQNRRVELVVSGDVIGQPTRPSNQ
jgi:outer membrane protein OmpA-like peptidoglycan-associated protein